MLGKKVFYMILFCLPYAGGSESIYTTWRTYMPDSVTIVPLKLSGRGSRFLDPLYDSFDEMVEDVVSQIKVLATSPYAIFGHSMGALLAFEICHRLRDFNALMPNHVFFSGQGAPCQRKNKKIYHTMEQEQFIHELKEMKGTPEDFFANTDLLELYLPLIQNDFKLIETYTYKEYGKKIATNVTVLNGIQDDISSDALNMWKNHISEGYTFSIQHYKGDHFFINHHTQTIIGNLYKTLYHYTSEFIQPAQTF